MPEITINGTPYEIQEGDSILKVAKRNNIEIPTLCHSKALPPYGACRMCIVEISQGGRTRLATACTMTAVPGMEVQTDSERVQRSRKLTIELLLARCPEEKALRDIADEYGIGEPRFSKKDDNCILCGLCVRMCERIGSEAISFQNRGIDRELGTPYMDKSDVCITCGSCASICPTTRFTYAKVERISGRKPIEILSEFEMGMTSRHPVYIPFPQAIPKTPVIDKERCVYYLTGNCKTCKEFCEVEAIQYDQEDESKEIDITSVVVATGFDLIDDEIREEYGYGRFEDVLTGMEFERMLNAAGPTQGHVQTPSTGKEPKRIAFIQCVGSRDANCREYCSRVCCMYSIKEAMMAREHVPGLETSIYYMDMRTFGRGFQEYYNRARDEGIRFLHGRAAKIDVGADGKMMVHSENVDSGDIVEESYDMVILANAIVPSEGAKALAGLLEIELDENGFFKATDADGISTRRPGVFLAGCAEGPKDIPDSVTQASAAASKAMSLSPERIEVGERTLPMEDSDEKRVGVFICHCGSNIAGVVDVEAAAEYAKTLPGVVHADHTMFTCSDITQRDIGRIIKEKGLNRVVIASCSPRTHEPIFRETIEEAGVNPYLFEMANIRDQCSWVHMQNKPGATKKAKDLVRMAVARALTLKPLLVEPKDVTQTALVIGGGIAGMTSAIDMKEQGFDVLLVERNELGGLLNDIEELSLGIRASEILAYLKGRISELGISVVKAEVAGVEGSVGEFTTTLSNGDTYVSGVIILATGGIMHRPTILGYGEHPNVMTSLELEQRTDSLSGNVGFMLCVGANDETNPACSRFCCQVAVKQALALAKKGAHPYIFYKDIRTFQKGGEEMYKEAAEKGVSFIQYHKRPEFDGSTIMTMDDDPISVQLDHLVLSTGMEEPGIEELRLMLKVPKGKDGFFLEKHPKLGPVETNTDGIFVAGCANGPKEVPLTLASAHGAAAKAGGLLSKGVIYSEPIISFVDSERCMSCGVCVSVCPYGATGLDDEGIATINSFLCKGCGVCVATCPKRAISIHHYADEQIESQIDSFAGGDP